MIDLLVTTFGWIVIVCFVITWVVAGIVIFYKSWVMEDWTENFENGNYTGPT